MLKMCERVAALSKMKSSNLSNANTKYFSEPMLTAAGDQIVALQLEKQFEKGGNLKIQKTLIQDRQFAKLYQALLTAGITNEMVIGWLSALEALPDFLTAYSAEQLIGLSALSLPSKQAEIDYLRYFSDQCTNTAEIEMAVKNISHFYSQKECQISELTNSQRSLLQQPFFHAHILLFGHGVMELMQLLDENPALQELLQYLDEKQVIAYFDINDLRNLKWLQKDDLNHLWCVFEKLGIERIKSFMERWLENQATRNDLEWFLERIEPLSKKQKEDILGTQTGYLNALYSGKLQIPFDELYQRQIDVLVYAIVQKKQHFMELVSDHIAVFLGLDYSSILFEPAFYKRCNLNTLTLKSLEGSEGDKEQTSQLHLLEEKEYTFAELRALRYAKPAYIELYKKLDALSIDERLLVIRQLLRKDLLPEELTNEQLDRLAARFLTKPLSIWREKELAHIEGLKPVDSVRVLLAYDQIAKYLPEIHTWEEALFAARNAAQIQQYENWQQVRENILETDRDWKALAVKMDFSEEFIEENRDGIVRFLLLEGAEMSRMYYQDSEKKDAFRRIVQAELMGKFRTLKYYADDLRKEISYPIGETQGACWTANRSLAKGNFVAEETDDFYTTLRLGELPYSTCLSYFDGAQKKCLLSAFDSNKKILLAHKGGTIVGRAVIRLTKGSFQQPKKEEVQEEASLEFIDLLAEEVPVVEPVKNKEILTLFLERLYTSQVNDWEQQAIRRMFIRLVTEKAAQLGAMPVLANEYKDACEESQYVDMGYYMYISKSKGGAQYLDSLSGSIGVSQEDSYQKSLFLIPQADMER